MANPLRLFPGGIRVTEIDRYSRQIRFSPFGPQGQQRLERSTALVCGCGALGTLIAERLVRAGIGQIRLVDRDWVEWSNLQRQTLFTETDAEQSLPKAVAAANALQKINSSVSITPFVEDITYANLPELASGCDLILDGTDNFETRFLINDYCIAHNTPWVHGGCLGASGQILAIVPGKTACFRCLVPDLPPANATETCDSAGVLGPAIGIIASWQTAEAMKILSGNLQQVQSHLIAIDSWSTDCRIIALPRSPKCPCCGLGQFPFLEGTIRSETTVLCGKNAVQVQLPTSVDADLDRLAQQLAAQGTVTANPFFVRLQLHQHTITFFASGRTVVQGTTSPAEARSLLARTLGT
ncbi:MAG: thiazole biosynthesis adenylyltransferase ThiF [Planctomycetota bacterium]|nr:MAG: thiazole biosynthesis adenylyltransferase ThiF [Planctomycetota bacterium]